MVLLIAFPFFHIAKTRLTFIGGAKFGHLSRDGLTRLPSISCNASTVYSCLVPWQQKNGRAPTPSFIDYISPPSFVACGLVDFDIFIYFLWLPFSLWMLHKYPEFLSSVTTGVWFCQVQFLYFWKAFAEAARIAGWRVDGSRRLREKRDRSRSQSIAQELGYIVQYLWIPLEKISIPLCHSIYPLVN